MSARHEKVHCEGCNHDVVPVRPRWYWRAAQIAAWVYLPVLCFVTSPSGMGVVLAAPYVLFVGAMLLGPLAERAGAAPKCPECRRELPEPRKAPAARGPRLRGCDSPALRAVPRATPVRAAA